MGIQTVDKWRVKLKKAEVLQLKKLVSSGKAPARKIMRARILLLSNEAKGYAPMKDSEIVAALDVCRGTIQNVRRGYIQQGLEACLERNPQPARPEKLALDGKAEAHLIALACSEPPTGYGTWTMRLLAQEMVSLGYCQAVSKETVRKALKKMNLNHGKKRVGAFRRRQTPTS